MEDQSNKRMKINEHAKDAPSDNSRIDTPASENATSTVKKVYPRKVSSMFASNRAIHQLTENIVRNSEQTKEAQSNTDTNTANSSSHEVTPARKDSDDELLSSLSDDLRFAEVELYTSK